MTIAIGMKAGKKNGRSVVGGPVEANLGKDHGETEAVELTETTASSFYFPDSYCETNEL